MPGPPEAIRRLLELGAEGEAKIGHYPARPVHMLEYGVVAKIGHWPLKFEKSVGVSCKVCGRGIRLPCLTLLEKAMICRNRRQFIAAVDVAYRF